MEHQRDETGVRSVVEQESRGLGFCPDLQPDLSVGRAQGRLLVGSQDVAHHLETLRGLGVTHILNVAWGVPNAFPDVSVSQMSALCPLLPCQLFSVASIQ